MKKIKILIIILVAVLILTGATFATLYFVTDIFKSNKEMFYKYISQVDLSAFVNADFYENYSNKLKNNKYKENTKITIDYEGKDIASINKEINIESKRDLQNKLSSSEITVGNEDKTDIKLSYLRNEDIYGVLLNDIVNQYIAVENNNLKELATKLGIGNANQIPDKIEISKGIQNEIVTEQEMSELINRYKEVILNAIPDDCYSKIKKERIEVDNNQIEADGYKISINIEQFKQILTSVLQELMNDEQLYNIGYKVNQELTLEEYKEGLEFALESINEIEIDEENKNISLINLIVYKKENETKKVDLEIGIPNTYVEISIENNNPKIKISYVQEDEKQVEIQIHKSINTQEQENLNISIISQMEELLFNININVKREGSSNSEQVKNEMELKFESEEIGTAGLRVVNNVEFDDSIDIQKFNESNKLVINGLTQEQISNLFTNLGGIISEKIKDETIYIYAVLGMPFAAIEGTILEQEIVSGMVGLGVSISVVMTTNLVERTEIVTQQTKSAADEEELTMEIVMALGQTGEINLATLKTNLVAKDWKVTMLEDKAECTSINGNVFYVDEKGKIEHKSENSI